MKIIVCCAILSIGCYSWLAQVFDNVKEIQPDKDFENILVKPISSDSLTSSFVIWIKKSVKLHKHISHTEQVYIVEGSGTMQLGDSTFNISSGSYVTIPQGTPHGVSVNSKSPLKVISIQSPRFEGKDRHFLD